MKKLLFLIGILFICFSANAQQDTLMNMSLEELMNIDVVVATRVKSTLDESPSIVTVIDRKTIELSSAQTLADIIRTIPGLDYSKGSLGWGEPLDEFYGRGIVNDFSQTILILLNGCNKFNDFTYASPFMSTRINIEMIERIEVIRGPGSALYGGNAFAAVINIITRDVGDKPETLFEQSITNHKGASTYFLTKNKLFKSNWMLGMQGKYFFDGGTTYESVQIDKKYTLQKVQNPEQITDGVNPSYDLSVNISSPDKVFRAQFWHTNHNPHPFLTGFFPQPNNDNYKYQGIQSFVNMEFEPIKNLRITSFYSYMKWDSRLTLYWDEPIRKTIPVYGNDDLYAPTEKNKQGQVEINYSLNLGNHNLLFGGSFYSESQIDPQTTYWNGTAEQIYTEKDDISYVSYLTKYRNQVSGYIQDYWKISKTLEATIGLRYDNYNDIKDKNIYNPRLALVWNAFKNNKFKILYGEAFRPPSGFEVSGILYPLTGNPNFSPEKVRTGEIAYINYSSFARLQLNVFYNKVENAIGIGSDGNYANLGEVNAYGFEAELQGKFWWINYSYVSSKIKKEGEDSKTTYFIAPYSINAGIHFILFDKLTVRNQICIKGERKTFTGEDTKMQYDDDLSLNYNFNNIDFILGCRNIFDQKWEMPLNDGGIYKYPYRGREFFVKAIVRFN